MRFDDPVRTEVTESGTVPVVLLVLLVALLLTALGARGRLRVVAAALLLPVSVAWVLFNGPIEGPILVTFSVSHGLTVSDLLAGVGLVVGVTVLALARRGPRRAPRD